MGPRYAYSQAAQPLHDTDLRARNHLEADVCWTAIYIVRSPTYVPAKAPC